jgi:hypothetical protein
MEQYDNDINDNNRNRKKTAIETKMHWRFITSIALPTLSLLLTIISAAPTYPVQATAGSNETAATPAPGGASIGPAGGGGTNVTQSDCLPHNATTRGSLAVDAGDATATAANDTTTTFAPQGAGIGANDTSASNATAGNTITANDTTTTFAPQGAGVC